MKIFLIATTLLFGSIGIGAAKAPEHVIFIGIDGFSSCSMEHVEVPTIRQLMAEGSHTLTKRTILPSSSAPNWASMFMGLPTELHGYTKWGSKSPEIETPYPKKNNILPTVFQVVKENKPEYNIGYIYEWDGMKYLADTLSTDYHQEAKKYLENKSLLTDLACNYIESTKPEFFGIIYASPDDMGHKYGFESPEYYAELESMDNQIKRIIETTEAAGILDSSVFIVTSDHGGIGKGHGNISQAEMNTPFIVWGEGIKKNHEIPELMMQYDVASVILDIFGIRQPSFWRGRSVDIKE